MKTKTFFIILFLLLFSVTAQAQKIKYYNNFSGILKDDFILEGGGMITTTSNGNITLLPNGTGNVGIKNNAPVHTFTIENNPVLLGSSMYQLDIDATTFGMSTSWVNTDGVNHLSQVISDPTSNGEYYVTADQSYAVVNTGNTYDNTGGILAYNALASHLGTGNTIGYVGGISTMAQTENTADTDLMYGLTSTFTASDNSTVNNGDAGRFLTVVEDSASVATLDGVWASSSLSGSASVTNLRALTSWITASGSSTLTNAYGFQIDAIQDSTSLGGTSVITNAAGIAVPEIGDPTNSTLLLLGTITIPSGQYSIYNSSAEPNYFAGDFITDIWTGTESNVRFGSHSLGTSISTEGGGYNGQNNSAIGTYSLGSITTGYFNNMIGYAAAYYLTTGHANNGIGDSVFASLTTGYRNNASGDAALAFLEDGYDNSAFGSSALLNLTDSVGVIGIGTKAGAYLNDGETACTSADNSIYIGYNSKAYAADEQNAIVIGANALGEGSNTTVIGNSSTVSAHIFGSLILKSETVNCVTNAGTAAVTTAISYLVTDGGSDNNEDTVSLADGIVNQVKIINYLTDTDGGDDVNVTPAHFANGNKIVFDTVGESCVMLFDGTNWALISNYGGTVS